MLGTKKNKGMHEPDSVASAAGGRVRHGKCCKRAMKFRVVLPPTIRLERHAKAVV